MHLGWMMGFSVKRNGQYKELIIKEGGGTIESGLLDREEAIRLATTLLGAAESLLPVSEKEEKVAALREELEKWSGYDE